MKALISFIYYSVIGNVESECEAVAELWARVSVEYTAILARSTEMSSGRHTLEEARNSSSRPLISFDTV